MRLTGYASFHRLITTRSLECMQGGAIQSNSFYDAGDRK